MFINYSNHHSKSWSNQQLEAAGQYGEIYDIPFPEISVMDTEKDIISLAKKQVKVLENLAKKNGKKLNDVTIMCQGEFSLTYAMIRRIKKKYPLCKVVCAVSERKVIEEREGDTTVKKAVFLFSGFREYR